MAHEPIDHESQIRNNLINERENMAIVESYNNAICEGAYDWLFHGAKPGKMVGFMQARMQRR